MKTHERQLPMRDPRKVFVGLSGGVDSAVSAALLQERGYDVTGVFIKIWQPEFLECSWREDRLDAMRVAAHLRLPFCEVDLSDAYKREVVQRMVHAYQAGRTPNPDVLCNTLIKFGVFMQWALAEGAGHVATGHYARTDKGHLFRGKDHSKDQSYFLHALSSEQLQQSIFPVGALEKRAVRAKARALDLPVAEKPDSQGLCFVGDITLPEFLGHYVTLHAGIVRDERGRVIGEHDGVERFTLGQRHGFRLHGQRAGVPHYVVAIHTEDHTLVVSEQVSKAFAREVMLESVNWIGERPDAGRSYLAQARYREIPVPVRLSYDAMHTRVMFDEPHLAMPGQSLVLYGANECLGGGVIREAVLNT